MQPDTRIPVTILTGFLGAGKTTLLNHLIQQHPERKFAIIENEYGEIPIDNDLVVKGQDSIFEMSNGCICCTLNDELVNTLAQLINSEYRFDHLLLETTGVAEPASVAAAFLASAEIQQFFRLDGVVCVADAPHIEGLLHDRDEAKRQLTFADFVILNKQSEVSAEQLAQIKSLLKSANPFAQVEAVDFAKIQHNVLELSAYEAQTLERKLHEIGAEADAHEHHHHHDHDAEHCEACAHGHAHEHEHHHHHQHTDIVSHSFVFREPLDLLKFRHWINVLLLVQSDAIYRIKGILNFAWQDQRIVFQSVQKLSAFQKGEPWESETARESRIVFIGKNLRRDILEKNLKHCQYQIIE